MLNKYIKHHGILGQKWGIRRFQNPDGSLTDEGRKRYGYDGKRIGGTKSSDRKQAREQKRVYKKDIRWAKRNQNKIYNQTYKRSKKEIESYRKELDSTIKKYNADGSISRTYLNMYNRKIAEVMNKNIDSIHSPSGKVISFVAKRGDVGVYMALSDSGFNMDQVKNGVFDSGKIAYKDRHLEVER